MHRARRSSMVAAAFCLVVIILPMIVSAEAQTTISETVDIQPASSDYDQKENLANQTFSTNLDTWPWVPDGVFVGGTVPESSMELSRLGTSTDNEFMITTVFQPQMSYLSSGSSEFVVRLPFLFENSARPYRMQLDIYELTEPRLYSFSPDADDQVDVTVSGKKIYTVWDVCGFLNEGADYWHDASHTSFVLEDRIYCHVICPLISQRTYLFCAWANWTIPVPFKMYWHQDDLMSDNITETGVVLQWPTAPDFVQWYEHQIAADAGWSFVFVQGIGDMGRSYNAYFNMLNAFFIRQWVEMPSASGFYAYNFILPFESNVTLNLTYTLTMVATGGGLTTTLLSESYWTGVNASKIVVAGNPILQTVNATLINGRYWTQVWGILIIENDPGIRMRTMLVYDENEPSGQPTHNDFSVSRTMATENDTMLRTGFSLWDVHLFSTSTILNGTNVIDPRPAAYTWLDFPTIPSQWIDSIASWLEDNAGMNSYRLRQIGGVMNALIKQNWALSFPLVAYIQSIWPDLKEAGGAILNAIIDGLTWLGSWIWKIASWIWDSLTWLVDQVVYYGSILLGLLIVLTAMFLFIVPIKYEIDLLESFLKMAQGDYAAASKKLGETSSSMRHLAGGGKTP